MSYPSASGLWAMEFLWNHYNDEEGFSPPIKANWADELFFCLLGGHSISFELNLSAFQLLKQRGYFEPNSDWDQPELLIHKLEKELSSPQYRPLKKNGSYRSYRFPNVKARIIGSAGCWLKNTCGFDIKRILTGDSKKDRDNLLNCPGLGYKTASWFLRNIGHGENLAIIDVHICRTLKDLGIIPNNLKVPDNYLEIEQIYCDACIKIGAKADYMDLIIWNWARSENVVRERVQ